MKIKKISAKGGSASGGKASVLVVSIIILGIVLMTALSISLATIRERKASIGSSVSDVAYQNAESGIETVMGVITSNSLTDISSLATKLRFSCANNSSGSAMISTSNQYSIQFKDSSDNYITSCTAPMSQVANIKSIGTDSNNQDTRAIEAAVASESLQWNNITSFSNSWTSDPTDFVRCAVDNMTGLVYLQGRITNQTAITGTGVGVTGSQIFTLPSACTPPNAARSLVAASGTAAAGATIPVYIIPSTGTSGKVYFSSNSAIANIGLGTLIWSTN